MSTTTQRVNLSYEPRIRAILERLRFRFTQAERAFWRARNQNATITLYRTGKLLIQSSSPGTLSDILFGTELRLQEGSLARWIGTDHAGSSDYFGPVTFAGVLFNRDHEAELAGMGLRDPKQLTPPALQMLIAQIKLLCPHSIVSLTSAKYNRVYERFGLHRLLGWGHARVIEDLLEKEPCGHAVSHQFAEEKFIREALQEKGRRISLIQRHHAEDNLGVQAASLLARDSQKKALEELSAKYSIVLPRGAMSEAVTAGRAFVSQFGKDKLKDVAKEHFITTDHILNPGPEFVPSPIPDASIAEILASLEEG
jgi:ribonuclease HIII